MGLALVLAGCQAPPSPALRAFGDSEYWVTLEDMDYRVGSTTSVITVKKGFVTDFASIPQPLRFFGLSPYGRYSRAAVLHDFLYWDQRCTKDQSDRLFAIAMRESGVGPMTVWFFYNGVHLGGAGAWRDNAEQRRAGLPRFVPDGYLKPDDPNLDWPTYRRMLASRGVRAQPPGPDPEYCRLGDSLAVP